MRILVIAFGFLVFGTGFVAVSWASYAGLGIPSPRIRPPSAREGSVRGPRAASPGTRTYFIGGGYHGGK